MGFLGRLFGRATKAGMVPIPTVPRRANPLISIPVYSVFGGGMAGAPLPLYMPGEPGWEALCRRKNVPLDTDPWVLAEMPDEEPKMTEKLPLK